MDAGMASTKRRFPGFARVRTRAIACGAIFLALSAGLLQAQDGTADVIRGHVVDDSSHAIVATIMVTRGPDRLVQQATTDSAGNFRVRFDVGTGDYLVYVSATARATANRRA